MADRFLCHFTFLAFTDAYWAAPAEEHKAFQTSFVEGLRRSIPRFDMYQVFPGRSDTDFLLWTTQPINNTGDTAAFFDCLAKSINPYRRFIQPTLTLWGYTGPSSYARGKSAQAIDPMEERSKPYLVVYPFVKTVDWYSSSRDARQGMMNEHIRVGHQYPEITQLLLYSTGLQDQEFVVIYETDNPIQFSELVAELRATDARRYTERDTPIFTAILHQPEEVLALSD